MADSELSTGQLRFIRRWLPPLEGGDYEVKVSHRINIGEVPTFSNSQTFSVQAPRFRLDASDIHSVFPAENSQGKHDLKLPHIVFNKRTLPWEHSIKNQEGDDQHSPWLALLILDQEDFADDAPHGKPAELQNAVRIKNKDDQTNGLKPSISDLFYGQQENDIVTVIRVNADTFTRIMPTPEEASLLVHAREVFMGHKEIFDHDHPGCFSVLVANRFPCNPMEHPVSQYAHVISLEGVFDLLDAAKKEPTGTVSLVSLYHWSFTCLPDHGESFSRFMKGLRPPEASPEASPEANDSLLRLPSNLYASNSNENVNRLLIDGFLPISCHKKTGDQDICWFRGPLSPVKIEAQSAANQQDFLTGADQAKFFDASTGLYNISYSVAWQTGRLLALSNRDFAISLLDWRKKFNHLLAQLAHLENQQITTAVLGNQEGEVKSLLHHQLVSKTFLEFLLSDFVQHLQADQPPSSPNASQESGSPAVVSEGDAPAAALTDQLKELLNGGNGVQLLYEMEWQDAIEIGEYLARASLLYDLPFECLIPDPRLLPPESIRFFYVDPNWIRCMIDGAMSLGVHSSKDSSHYNQSQGILRELVSQLSLAYRQKLLRSQPVSSSADELAEPDELAETNVCGFLLRSEVLTQFPGLEFKAYRPSSEQSSPDILCPALRIDRLSPTVLLCLFPTTPSRIEILEPSEGMCFGVEPSTVEPNNADVKTIFLRNPSSGEILTDQDKTPIDMILAPCHWRNTASNRILNVSTLAADLSKHLTKHLNSEISMTSDIFALQMVKVPEKMVFKSSNQLSP